MSDSPHIIELDFATLEAVVIENSFRAPVQRISVRKL